MAATPSTTPAEKPSWLDQRTKLAPLIKASLHVRIPMTAKTYYFGGIALFLFGIQVATGTLLSLYYKPTPEAAYKSQLRLAHPVHPPLDREPDDPVRGPAPGPRVHAGRLQVPA
jgi:hypothetical protein